MNTLFQTELHRHLDVSLRPSTLLELAQKKGIESSSTSLQSFLNKLLIRKPMRDLAEVLASFQICQKVLDRPEVLERVAREVCEDIYAEGTRRVELRYSPSFVNEFHPELSWKDILSAFESGIREASQKLPGFKAGLICIISRDYGPEGAEKTVDFFLENRTRFVGLDLAGNEQEFPGSLFRRAFQRAKKQGAKITIHAGESAGPDAIWYAIEELGAQRIGHGVSAVQDPQLLQTLRDRQICLEMCPTSNWLTQVVPSLEAHPLPQVLRAGIPVCINTDDPTLFATTLPSETRVCIEKMGLSSSEVTLTQAHAQAASFL
ncbi:MAG: adenosine deaminase [Bdellovibrionales bacterium]|nr:adenosine deaminase [Bdellovibrionales bacterium]